MARRLLAALSLAALATAGVARADTPDPRPKRWSGGAGVGFLANSPDGPEPALAGHAEHLVTERLSVGPLVQYGASPRATVFLAQASKAHAFIRGRGYVTPEDVKAVGPDVLRHRVILTYEAEAEEVSPEDVVKRVFDAVEVP